MLDAVVIANCTISSACDSQDSTMTDAVLATQVGHIAVLILAVEVRTYLLYLIIGEVVWVHLFLGGLSSLPALVAHIVGMGSQEKMIRSDALSVRDVSFLVETVAVMANKHLVGDGAIGDSPGDTRRFFYSGRDHHSAVSIAQRSGPQPTAVGRGYFIDPCPETINDRWGKINMHAVLQSSCARGSVLITRLPHYFTIFQGFSAVCLPK